MVDQTDSDQLPCRSHAAGEDQILPTLGRVGFDDPDTAQRLGEPAGPVAAASLSTGTERAVAAVRDLLDPDGA